MTIFDDETIVTANNIHEVFANYNPAGDDRRDHLELLGVLAGRFGDDACNAFQTWFRHEGGRELMLNELPGKADLLQAWELAQSLFCDWLTAEQNKEQARLDAAADAIEQKIQELCKAIEAALANGCEFRGRSSKYADYRNLTLRVSDHDQINGGGWSEARQERHGNADISWVVSKDSTVPTAPEIRTAAAKAIWSKR